MAADRLSECLPIPFCCVELNFAVYPSAAHGVSHKIPSPGTRDEKASCPPVPSSDSRSLKLQHDDVIACTLQILDHLPGGNLDDSRYVFTDDAMRLKLPDNAEHFRPRKTAGRGILRI